MENLLTEIIKHRINTDRTKIIQYLSIQQEIYRVFISEMTVLMLACKHNVDPETNYIKTAQNKQLISWCQAFRGRHTSY